jgi:hypothetical protein
MFTEDLSIFFDGLDAKPVSANGVSGLGIFDMPGEYVGPDGINISNEYQVRCLSSEFGTLKYDDLITIDGQVYSVRDNRPLYDGAFCRLSLSKPEGVIIGDFITTLDNLRLVTQDGRYLVTL